MISTVTISNHVIIKKAENPDLNFQEITDRYTFENPKFYENERLGFSNFATPRTIPLYKETADSIILPRGTISDLLKANPALSITDRTVTRPTTFNPPRIILKNYQKDPVNKMLQKNQGVLVSPPGSGKTVMGIEAIISRGQKVLILVHTKDLMLQWCDRFSDFTDIAPGRIDADRFDAKDITIAMVQSLNRPLEPGFINSFGLILLDETHHCPAFTFQKLINQFPAKYRYGLTATPNRTDGLTFLLNAVMGPVLYTVKKESLFQNGDILKPRVKVIHTGFYIPDCRDYGQLLAAITSNEQRNKQIIDCLIPEAAAGHSILILSERIAHVKTLYDMFSTNCPDVKAVCLTSRNTKKERETALRNMRRGALTVLFATKLADEGLDIRRLDRLFLTCPVRSSNKITQQVGRIQRTFPGKRSAVVFDFVDPLCGLAMSQFYTRKRKAYKDYELEEIEYHKENRERDGDSNNQEAI